MNMNSINNCEMIHNKNEMIDEESTQSLFIIDREGNIILSNTFTALTLGLTLEQLLKSNVKELVKKGFYNHSYVLDALIKKKIIFGKVKTNTGILIDTISTPIFDEHGEANLVVSTSLPQQQIEFENLSHLSTHQQLPEDFSKNDLLEDHSDHDYVVAESLAMKQIMKACDQIAPLDCKVLLFGESGTGKEVLANYIHHRSKRKKDAFVSVNCAAIPDHLFESELFGFEKGAFTGASSQKKGLIELADGGTLFLDEISELPLDLQAKLLRVLETLEVRRIGGTTTMKVNFRVIAATNKDLEKMVEKGTFRQDLYYRINVIPIHIPPLRKRKRDIIALANQFISEYNKKYTKSTKLTSTEIKYILTYNWPGNIRELKNYIERIVIMDTGLDELNNSNEEQDFLGDLQILDFSNRDHRPTLKEFLKEAEEKYILQVLSECDGKKGKAADMLGIYRTVLYRKLKCIEEEKGLRSQDQKDVVRK